VLRYNASLPSKFMPAPGYSNYAAPGKYAQVGYILFGGHVDGERRERLFTAVEKLIADVGLPRTLKDAGILEADFEAALPELVELAFTDMTMRTNPRMPLIDEIVDLLRKAYYGYDYEPETVHEEPPGPEVTTTKPPRRAAKRAAS